MTSTVLITGASQGSGKATALLFARNGYDVALTARQPERLEAVAAQIRALGRRAIAIPTDVGDPEQVQALVAKTLESFGQVDVLVNNAGICLSGAIEQTSLADWHQIMDTNFWGYVHTVQALLPHFLERKTGAIANVGSFGGKMPLPQMTAYCASKYAVTGFTDALRLELVPQGIHVCAIHPGVINSDFLERAQFRGTTQQISETMQQQMQSTLQAAWVSQPEDIAQAIWDAVRHQKAEVVVGATFWATELHRLFPGVTQWALQQATGK